MRAANRVTRKPKPPAEIGPQPLLLHGISWDAYELMLDAFAEERVRMTYDRGDLELTGPNMGDGEVPTLLVHGVSWEAYERLVDALEGAHVRLTYDEGVLELMAPTFNHEWWKRRLASLLCQLFVEFGINFQGGGSTTFKRKAQRKGVEPDECFYIKNVEQIRGKRALDLRQDPPPDLSLEVDVMSSSVRRFSISAKLGVGELWHFGRKGLRIHRLSAKKKYRQVKKSAAVPFLPIDEFFQFLCENQELTEYELAIEFRKWIKKHIPPEAMKR